MTDLQHQVDELRAELSLLHACIAVNEWKHMQDRFHAFDAIRDDRCPACGSAVVVMETEREVTLRARA